MAASAKQALVDDASPNLDFLRAFAVTLVFFAHFVATLTYGSSTPYAGYFGWFGVIAFFVHTSLVLMRSLERLDSDSRGRIVLRFYIRRLFRIYPLSIACVLLVTAFSIPLMPWVSFVPPGRAVLLANLLLIQNLFKWPDVSGPLWSLPYEVQMYLFLPACYFALRRVRNVPLPLVWISSIVIWLPYVTVDRSRAQWIPCFLSGVMVYAWQKKSPARFLPPWVFGAVLAAASVAYATAQMWAQSIGPHAPLALAVMNWLAAVAIACAIPVSRDMSSPFVCSAAQKVAKYSYGIYLTHTPLLWVCFRFLNPALPFWARLTLFGVMAVALPVLAYHVLEAPLIDWGKRVAARVTRASQSFSAAIA